MRKIKLTGTGVYLPKQRIAPMDLAKKMGVSEDAVRKLGVESRYYANTKETASYMGARAVEKAINDAGLKMEDIDLIICASGTMQMPIPCTAALIHHELKFMGNKPAFDINSTCLSFLTALDMVSYQIADNRYKNVVIVSSEIASIGLNYNDLESATLFSDGAAAVVVSICEDKDNSGILAVKLCTLSEGWDYCKIPGGGTGYPPQKWVPGNNHMFQFHMDGKALFKTVLKVMPDFLSSLFEMAETSMEEIDLVIPHQASLSSMNIFQKKLGINNSKMVNIFKDYGNMIAASIPFSLDHARKSQKISSGSRVLLLGTSAGISLGGLILDY